MSEPRVKTFPIMGQWDRTSRCELRGFRIPWEIIEPHEKQAMTNHGGQNLEKLASRGGLGFCEAVAVLEDRDWHPMDARDALRRLEALTARQSSGIVGAGMILTPRPRP